MVIVSNLYGQPSYIYFIFDGIIKYGHEMSLYGKNFVFTFKAINKINDIFGPLNLKTSTNVIRDLKCYDVFITNVETIIDGCNAKGENVCGGLWPVKIILLF